MKSTLTLESESELKVAVEPDGERKQLNHGRSTQCIGDGRPPTFNDGNPYNEYINPYYWVDEFIPYYMEIMGV